MRSLTIILAVAVSACAVGCKPDSVKPIATAATTSPPADKPAATASSGKPVHDMVSVDPKDKPVDKPAATVDATARKAQIDEAAQAILKMRLAIQTVRDRTKLAKKQALSADKREAINGEARVRRMIRDMQEQRKTIDGFPDVPELKTETATLRKECDTCLAEMDELATLLHKQSDTTPQPIMNRNGNEGRGNGPNGYGADAFQKRYP
jgi:hypothetical protein